MSGQRPAFLVGPAFLGVLRFKSAAEDRSTVASLTTETQRHRGKPIVVAAPNALKKKG